MISWFNLSFSCHLLTRTVKVFTTYRTEIELTKNNKLYWPLGNQKSQEDLFLFTLKVIEIVSSQINKELIYHKVINPCNEQSQIHTMCLAALPSTPLFAIVVLLFKRDCLAALLIFCFEECVPRSTYGWQPSDELNTRVSTTFKVIKLIYYMHTVTICLRMPSNKQYCLNTKYDISATFF